MFSATPRSGNIHLLEHEPALPRDVGRGRLGRRHDHRPVQGKRLDQGQLCIARAGRQVDDQNVEFAPFHVLHELLDGLHDHRAPQTTGVSSSTRNPMLITFTPWRSIGSRRDSAPSPSISGLPLKAHHQGDARPVDVAIEEANAARAAPKRRICARTQARLTAKVLFPTPPLPEAMATARRTSREAPGLPPAGPGAAGARAACTASSTAAPETPGTARTGPLHLLLGCPRHLRVASRDRRARRGRSRLQRRPSGRARRKQCPG